MAAHNPHPVNITPPPSGEPEGYPSNGERVEEIPAYQPPVQPQTPGQQLPPAEQNPPEYPDQPARQPQQQYSQTTAQQYVNGPPPSTQLEVAPGQVAQRQVYWSPRPHMPEAPDVPEEAKKRHEKSKRLYPDLNLSRGEFIISAVRRHPVGLISIWFTAGLVIVLSIGILLFLIFNQGTFLNIVGGASTSLLLAAGGIALLLSAMAILGGFIATYVYRQNRFFLTNESVIQCIQAGLFSRREQTVSLQNIEDASYRQHGIVQHMLNFGTIRLSTQGDETTYRFSYVSNPKHQIALLNNAVEAFKNGRPVMHLED